jgi:tetratricopeptide (TPR) repeat protein/DNA-binding MarR family transcriptional regulator
VAGMTDKNAVTAFKLTVQERILLHLSEYSKYVDQLQVPFALTQEGIAESVGVVRSAIPRAIKKLISKDFAKEQLAHVDGLSRRRKIYYLTTDGLVQAMELKNKLLAFNVTLINSDNKTITCKIQEISEKVQVKLNLLDVILNLDSDNVFNFPEFGQTKKMKKSSDNKPLATRDDLVIEEKTQAIAISGKPGARAGGLGGAGVGVGIGERGVAKVLGVPVGSVGLIHYTDKAPKISTFVGRKNELEQIHKMIGHEECKIIIVHGVPGIGKTTLAVKLLDDLKKDFNLFWYRCHEWDTIRNVLTSISRFTESQGKTQLKRYLEANQNIDLNEVADILEIELHGLDAIFFLDDFHKINEPFIALFTLIREMLERISGIQFLLLSRSIISFYDRREVVVKKLISEIELAGLNEKESKELLKARKIKVENFEQIYEFTKGHPLSLELYDPSTELHEQKNIGLYLEEEVLARLSIREKSLLKIASVFRYPVPADGFFIFEKAQISRETLSILARKSLIKKSKEGYEVHDLIRDFFYGYLSPQDMETYHRKIGEFYLGQLKMINTIMKNKLSTGHLPKILPDTLESMVAGSWKPKKTKRKEAEDMDLLLDRRARGILESLYHFLKAHDYNRTAEVAIIMGHELLNLKYAEELLEHLDKLDTEKISDEFKMDLSVLKGDLLSELGNPAESLEQYQRSIVIAEDEDNKTKLAELYRKLGSVQEKLKDYNSAIDFLNRSLAISKMLGDAKGITDAYGELGDIYWKMSEFDKSNEFYNKSMECAEEISDLPGKAKTYLTLGMISAKRGQFEESIKYYERCLDILDKGKGMDGFNYSNFYGNLSDHYLKTIFSYYIQSNGKND